MKTQKSNLREKSIILPGTVNLCAGDYRTILFKSLKSCNDDSITDKRLSDFSDMLIGHKLSIPSLYRYSSADYNNIRGLEKGELFLAPLGTMNDIFEGLSCDTDSHLVDQLNDLKDLVYIKSFSESYDNLRMWSAYADNYSGMCVEYDFSQMDEPFLRHLFPVCYSRERLTFDVDLDATVGALKGARYINYIEDRLFDTNKNLECFLEDIDFTKLMDVMPLFLIKSEDWRYEQEWRLLATYLQLHCDPDYYMDRLKSDEDIADEQQLHNIKQNVTVTSAIKAVYLGPRMLTKTKEHVKEICGRFPPIQCFETKVSDSEYRIEKVAK